MLGSKYAAKTRQHKINIIDSTNSRENIKCQGSLNSKLTIFRMAYMHSTLEHHVCKNLNVTTLPAYITIWSSILIDGDKCTLDLTHSFRSRQARIH